MFSQFLVGQEQECLTALTGSRPSSSVPGALADLFHALRKCVPSLAGKAGLFTPCGRIYCDGAHLELATAECSSPYQLPIVAEQLETIIAEALKRCGVFASDLVLASVNHDGLLQSGATISLTG